MAQNSSVQTPSLVTMSAQPFANENDPSKERPLMSRRSKLARRFMNAVQWAERRNAFGLTTDRARLVRLFFQPLLVALAIWSTRPARP